MLNDSLLGLDPLDSSLLTDLYQLTMTACYVGEGIDQRWASFELFTRRLPKHYGYLVAMGLAQALEYLEALQFSPEQIVALQATGLFAQAPNRFWELLASTRFSGDVWAVPEGTVMFANEPLLRIEAPLWQAQIVETYLLNILNYQTLIATKAARIRDVAGDRATLLEFGSRRAFSPQGAVWAARAALAAGFNATSNVLAALKLGQKPSGTMAHALVMALAAVTERESKPADHEAGWAEDLAFEAFHRYFPAATLLIDTYDSLAAAHRLAEQVKAGTTALKAVRLDSGDLVSQSQQIRQLLPDVAIVASGDLDEFEIVRLQAEGAIIDAYGLGTQLVTGAPVNGVYKLVEIDHIPVMKEASQKVTYPGRKQVFRRFGQPQSQGQSQDQFQADRLGLADEPPAPDEQPLLQLVMRQGERLTPSDSLSTIAARSRAAVTSLPPALRQIEQPSTIQPQVSPALQALTDQTRRHSPSASTLAP